MNGGMKLKIYIKLADGKKFWIPAPIGIVKAALGLGGFGVSIARRYIPEEQRQYIDCIDFRELRKGFDVLKAYKGLTLVDVKAKDGTVVTIIV